MHCEPNLIATTTTVTSTKTSTAVTQLFLGATVQQSRRNNSLRMTSPSVSSHNNLITVQQDASHILLDSYYIIFWILVLWSILLGKSEFMHWMFQACFLFVFIQTLNITTSWTLALYKFRWFWDAVPQKYYGFVWDSQYQKIWEPPIFTTINWCFHYCRWSYDKTFFHSSLLFEILSRVHVSPLSIAFLWSSLIWYLHSLLGLRNGQ